MTLLSREQFRKLVFARDNNKCVFCENFAVDAHHIIERRLFDDGGYYLDNGISVCEKHHLDCEATEISVEQARQAASITKIVLPPHLYRDQVYDKWGNPILSNGSRLKGELFYDDSVQKILRKKLSCFIEFVKYPRTYHLPWSNPTKDDRVIKNTDIFKDKVIVVTDKMDGENTSLYKNHLHARSIDGINHASRNWVKNFWSQIRHEIPDGYRICGENLYAKHSIKYNNLQSYFLGFSIWDEKNNCLSWPETLEWFKLLGIEPVTSVFQGIYNEDLIKEMTTTNYGSLDFWKNHEGYVIRLSDNFHYSQFRKSVAKYVRPNHVSESEHWFFGKVMEKNELHRR